MKTEELVSEIKAFAKKVGIPEPVIYLRPQFRQLAAFGSGKTIVKYERHDVEINFGIVLEE